MLSPSVMACWRSSLPCRQRSLNDRVQPCGFSIPLRAELWDPLQGGEVDVDQAEPVAEAGEPFEVVLGAPVEVSVHRQALRRRPLELAQAGAQEHYPVCVIDVPVPGSLVRRGAAVLGDEDRLW